MILTIVAGYTAGASLTTYLTNRYFNDSGDGEGVGMAVMLGIFWLPILAIATGTSPVWGACWLSSHNRNKAKQLKASRESTQKLIDHNARKKY